MQDYQISSEDDFSREQIKNSEKIVLMTVIQIVIILVIGLFQGYTLKKVFKFKA